MITGRKQNNNRVAAAYPGTHNDLGGETRGLGIAVSASLVCHLIFFTIFAIMQTQTVKRRPLDEFMRVDLVSLPGAAAPKTSKEAAPAPAAKKAKPAPATAKAATVKSEPRKEVSTAPTSPKKKVSLKKRTFKSENVKKRALEKIEQQVETTSSERIAKAIDELKSKVEEEVSRPQKPASSTAEASSAPGDGQEDGGRRAELIDIYRVEVAYQIQKNWAFPDQFAEDNADLETRLVFKILPNGEITDLFFTDRSGNRYFDESAYRAVIKSNPVAPHPQGLSQPYVQMGVRFTPEGIK
jgi:colicin import membrane protein